MVVFSRKKRRKHFRFSSLLVLLLGFYLPILMPSPSTLHFFPCLPTEQAEPQGRRPKSHCGRKRGPLEKTSRDCKHAIILAWASKMTTFAASAVCTHPSLRQNTDDKRTIVRACWPKSKHLLREDYRRSGKEKHVLLG